MIVQVFSMIQLVLFNSSINILHCSAVSYNLISFIAFVSLLMKHFIIRNIFSSHKRRDMKGYTTQREGLLYVTPEKFKVEEFEKGRTNLVRKVT